MTIAIKPHILFLRRIFLRLGSSANVLSQPKYFRDGVIYSLQRKGRVLLADDMGLGKTIQALAIASAYKSDWPLLIVCPSSVRFAWRSAVVRWLPSVPEEEVAVITSGRDELDGNVIIISYDLLSRKQDELVRYFF